MWMMTWGGLGLETGEKEGDSGERESERERRRGFKSRWTGSAGAEPEGTILPQVADGFGLRVGGG